MAQGTESEFEIIDTGDYRCQAFSRFQEFRDDDLLCDLKLKVENQTFKVHRLIMAGCSDYFRALFSHNMADSSKSSIELHSVSVNGLRPLIEFAYSGKLSLTLKSVPDILAVATFLQITTAIQICVDFLKKKMTFSNSAEIIGMGEEYGIPDLAKHYKSLILENFAEFAETNTFLNMDAKNLVDILKSNSLRIDTESNLLKYVLKWYHFDKSRDKDAYEVFEKIRYTLDGWSTIEYACRIEPFINNSQCRDLIDSCHRYMQNANKRHLHQSHRTRVRYDSKTLVQFGGIINASSGFLDYFEDNIFIGNCRNEYYHKDLKVWLPLGVVGISDSRSHATMVDVNDCGIICGGYLHTDLTKHCTNEVKLFTTGGFSIWDLPYMKTDRAHHVCVAVKDFLYVIGGRNDLGPLKTVEKYDLHRERWTFVKQLEEPVYDHAGAAYEDLVFICGGKENTDVSNQVKCYIPEQDQWQSRSSMLTARYGHSMSTVNNQIIVCGGRPSQDDPRCLASVELYNVELDQWSFSTPMRNDCSFMAASVMDGKLFLVGGENSVGDLDNAVKEYDPATEKWGEYCKLKYPMKNTAVCALTIKLDKSDVDSGGYPNGFAELYDDIDVRMPIGYWSDYADLEDVYQHSEADDYDDGDYDYYPDYEI